MDLLNQYNLIRKQTETICAPLETEDYVVQPIVDVSPPKWHLGHTTWFFETFILKPFYPRYREYNPEFNFVFNSYYETIGARVLRTDRGNLSRPSVDEIYIYRAYVDEHMNIFIPKKLTQEIEEILVLGLNHEQQHQELLVTDIKYILGHNPLFPSYNDEGVLLYGYKSTDEMLKVDEGIYEIGFKGEGFCFDNELNAHKVFLPAYEISKNLVTNGDYLEFMNAGGYQNFMHWHAEGLDWVNQNHIKSPQYWHFIDGEWQYYTLTGLRHLDLNEPVCHINYYEACAFAAWKELRLPTEAEWEVAAPQLDWGQRWEWTESAYLPYPGFKKAAGAIGEYNGKFMVNQMVLRGASVATAINHSRTTYRNFFHPSLRWQFTGLRLAK